MKTAQIHDIICGMKRFKTKWAAYQNRGEGETAVQDGDMWVVLTEAEHKAYRRNLNQQKKRQAGGKLYSRSTSKRAASRAKN